MLNQPQMTKGKKKGLLITLGALQVAAGATVAVAPHLATVLGPTPFAIAMIVTGIGSAVLGFINTQLATDQEE
jgi:uncharacterized membrane protein HdeD (DUF308 family)